MIYLGADHGGFALKEQVKQWLADWKLEFTDVGAMSLDPNDDYPTFAFGVAEAVAKQPKTDRGILLCRSAAGVVIAANKVPGVRAVAPFNEIAAKHSREHNDSNVIGLSGDWLSQEEAKTMVYTWLTTKFSEEERHQRRLDMISDYEQHHA